jgi:MFS family permease
LAVPAALAVPRGLVLICCCTAAWAFNFGLATQLSTLWLKEQGHSNTVIGLNQGLYYLGLAVVVMLVPRLLRRWGPRCAVAGLVLAALSTVLLPHAATLAAWYALRLLNGAASALTLIPLETYISRDARPEHRSRNFGIYAVALTLGGGLGIGLGPNLFEPGNSLPFWLGGTVVVLAALAFLGYRSGLSDLNDEAEARVPVRPGRSFLSYGTAWSQGFLEGGLLAFLLLYLLSLGLSDETAGYMQGASVVGILLFQVPISWLGDRLGRTAVLLVCYAMVVAGLAALPLCAPGLWLVFWLFLLGGCCGAFYPLGVALLGDGDSEMGVARAYAWYMILESVGSQMGPPLMGIARDWWGEKAMFAVGEAALVCVLLSWLMVRLSLRSRAAGAAAPPSAGPEPRGRDAA